MIFTISRPGIRILGIRRPGIRIAQLPSCVVGMCSRIPGGIRSVPSTRINTRIRSCRNSCSAASFLSASCPIPPPHVVAVLCSILLLSLSPLRQISACCPSSPCARSKTGPRPRAASPHLLLVRVLPLPAVPPLPLLLVRAVFARALLQTLLAPLFLERLAIADLFRAVLRQREHKLCSHTRVLLPLAVDTCKAS